MIDELEKDEFKKYYDTSAIINVYFNEITRYLSQNGLSSQKMFWRVWENRSISEQYIKDLVLDSKSPEEISQLADDLKNERNSIDNNLPLNERLQSMKILGNFSNFVCNNISSSGFKEYQYDNQDPISFEVEYRISCDNFYNFMRNILFDFDDNFGSPNPITPPESN